MRQTQQLTQGEWKLAYQEARIYAQTGRNETPERYQSHLWLAYSLLVNR